MYKVPEPISPGAEEAARVAKAALPKGEPLYQKAR
jgi:hypothetical protein